MSEDELIAANDAQTNTSDPGTYYLDELHRRAELRALEASATLARRSFWLSVTNTLIAVVAVAIALLK